MKILLLSLAFLSASTSFAAKSECEALPKSQQAIFKAYNAYLKSNAEIDALVFIGSVMQYEADVETFGDQKDPDFGNTYTADIFESKLVGKELAEFEDAGEQGGKLIAQFRVSKLLKESWVLVPNHCHAG